MFSTRSFRVATWLSPVVPIFANFVFFFIPSFSAVAALLPVHERKSPPMGGRRCHRQQVATWRQAAAASTPRFSPALLLCFYPL
ncbi:unnamed protein product, partial [Iphiclides podalirius]